MIKRKNRTIVKKAMKISRLKNFGNTLNYVHTKHTEIIKFKAKQSEEIVFVILIFVCMI